MTNTSTPATTASQLSAQRASVTSERTSQMHQAPTSILSRYSQKRYGPDPSCTKVRTTMMTYGATRAWMGEARSVLRRNSIPSTWLKAPVNGAGGGKSIGQHEHV